MASYSYSVGRFTAALTDAAYSPRVFHKARPLVVFMPGNTVLPQSGPLSAGPLILALLTAGFPVVQPNVDQLMGNATGMTRITDAITWGRANLPCTTNPVCFVGASNGGVHALQYLRQNPSSVAAAVTLITPVDLNWGRDNNVAGLRAIMDAAWGVTWSSPGVQALPAHADLLSDAASYSTVGPNVQAWVSTNDPLDNTASGHSEHDFATTIGADYHSAGAVGHAEASWSGLDIPTALAFIQART